jgi:hypothetical protein
MSDKALHSMGLGDGLDGVRQDIDDAVPPPTEYPDGPDGGSNGGAPSGRAMGPGDPDWPLPEGCPVVPLGVNGGTYFYIDSAGQYRQLEEREHNRLHVEGLFNLGVDWLWAHFEGRDKDGEPSGKIQCEKIGWQLRQACTLKGVWDPATKMRGVGAWRDADGRLILHCGDGIWQSGSVLPPDIFAARWHRIGEIGGYVYPAMPPQPRPLEGKIPGGMVGSPAGELLDAISSWSFRRGAIDERLIIGWIAAAMIGGALKWRPAAWVTGDKGTGKSTLLEVVGRVLGGSAVVTSDATAAGIWQHVGLNSLPVILDEQEAEEDNRKASNILKLARQASSGGVVIRGGANHKGSEFTARSCFLFSSILVPPMQPQDKSRMAILELDPLANEGPEPELSPKHWGPIGKALRRRMAMGWPRFEATRAAYYEALKGIGHEARGADQFGTLLAAADLLFFDTAPDPARLAKWTGGLESENLSEVAGAMPDWRQGLNRLLQSSLDVRREGGLMNVIEWLMEADGAISASAFKDITGDSGQVDEPAMQIAAERAISRSGLKVHIEGPQTRSGRAPGSKWLVVANNHLRLAQIFEGTKWGTIPGAQGSGWSQAFARVPGVTRGRARFAGEQGRALFIPWAHVIGGEDEDLQ